jgi:hypothetical protein
MSLIKLHCCVQTDHKERVTGDYAPLGTVREGAKCLGLGANLEGLPLKE